MKNLKLVLTAIILTAFSFISSAQYYGGGARTAIALNSGDVAGLKGVTDINIIYDYSKTGVGGYKNEADYLKKKEEDYKKDPPKFEKFKQNWYSSRKERFEPKFEALFNKVGAKAGIAGKNYGTSGPVTLKVETLFIEPGYNVGVSKMPSFVDFECTFMDKDGKEIVRYFIKNAVGSQMMGFDYDAGSRLTESYAIAAKLLMKDVTKRLKKLK